MKKEAELTYDKIAGVYHEKRVNGRDLNELSEQPATFELLGDVKGRKILDAGCGSGIYSRLLAKKGAEVFGLEISSEMINLAECYCKDYKIHFIKGSISKIPFKDNTFDIVVASLVIHYLRNPKTAFKEFNRVLKKQGILIFSTTHPILEAFTKIRKIKCKNEITLSDYFKKGKYYWTLHSSKVKIPSYRTGFELISDLIYNNGFILEKIKETSLSGEIRNIPEHLKKFINIPIYLIFKVRKR